MTILCGLDLETTGLDWLTGHKIVECAAVLYDLETEKYLGKYVQRINPCRPIDPKAQAVHKISFEELALEPLWAVVAPKLHAVLSKCDAVVAHNGRGFDVPFLAHEFKAVGLSMPNCLHHCVDTMVDGRWSTPMGKLPNLKEFCFATDTPYDPDAAHSADYDTTVLMQSFFAARRWGYFQNVKQTAAIAA